MTSTYEVIINGYLQKTFSFTSVANALKWVADLKADGRLTEKDKVVIRTTIVIEDEVTLWF